MPDVPAFAIVNLADTVAETRLPCETGFSPHRKERGGDCGLGGC